MLSQITLVSVLVIDLTLITQLILIILIILTQSKAKKVSPFISSSLLVCL